MQYQSNLAYAAEPSETFDIQAANAASIEPSGVYATDGIEVLRILGARRRHRKPLSFKDSQPELRAFRIY